MSFFGSFFGSASVMWGGAEERTMMDKTNKKNESDAVKNRLFLRTSFLSVIQKRTLPPRDINGIMILDKQRDPHASGSERSLTRFIKRYRCLNNLMSVLYNGYAIVWTKSMK